jgi:addiction module RelB/DinJ family antitoxin
MYNIIHKLGDTMKTVNLQVRINEDLKQEVSSILKAQGLSYTSMLDALFRQIIKERRIPFAIALPTAPIDETPTPSTLNNGTYEQPQTTLKASETINRYGNYGNVTPNEGEVAFDTIDKTGVLNIRINPKVKTLTTAILKEMGLTMSQTVTLVSKQIQFNKDIPPTILRPEWIDAINNDFWTEEDLTTRIQLGLNQAEKGIGEPAEKIFNELLEDL